MRFADSRSDEGPSRMVGFSRGLQDELRRRIERMVRKPASQETNNCTERDGSDETPDPDFEGKGNCEEERDCKKVNFEGNLELEAKPRRAWPTPRRVNNLKVAMKMMRMAMMTMEMEMVITITMPISNMHWW